MASGAGAPVDVVITWVDDRWPGYRNELRRHAAAPADLDPARTRDNLEILRFGLRALERRAPWVNHVYLLTCRPQVPHWLADAHPRLSVIHHDEIIPARLLPTFNSFSIISHMHQIPGLADTFLYLEDDMLLLNEVALSDFADPDGRLIVFEQEGPSPRHVTIRDPEIERPWNLALAEANRLLDGAFGPAQRGQVNHVPLLVQKYAWQAMIENFPEAFERTRRSRFRAAGNIAPEFLYPHLVLANGGARRASPALMRASCGYVPLENVWPATAFALWHLRRRQPKWVTLNDNLGNRPNRVTERLAKRFLHYVAPQPSSFERA